MKTEVREDLEALRIAVYYKGYRNFKKWHGTFEPQ